MVNPTNHSIPTSSYSNHPDKGVNKERFSFLENCWRAIAQFFQSLFGYLASFFSARQETKNISAKTLSAPQSPRSSDLAQFQNLLDQFFEQSKLISNLENAESLINKFEEQLNRNSIQNSNSSLWNACKKELLNRFPTPETSDSALSIPKPLDSLLERSPCGEASTSSPSIPKPNPEFALSVMQMIRGFDEIEECDEAQNLIADFESHFADKTPGDTTFWNLYKEVLLKELEDGDDAFPEKIQRLVNDLTTRRPTFNEKAHLPVNQQIKCQQNAFHDLIKTMLSQLQSIDSAVLAKELVSTCMSELDRYNSMVQLLVDLEPISIDFTQLVRAVQPWVDLERIPKCSKYSEKVNLFAQAAATLPAKDDPIYQLQSHMREKYIKSYYSLSEEFLNYYFNLNNDQDLNLKKSIELSNSNIAEKLETPSLEIVFHSNTEDDAELAQRLTQELNS